MEKLKVAFFGSPKIAQIVLAKLIDTQYKPSLVVTSQSKKVGRGQKVSPSPVAETAQANNLKIISTLEELNESFDLAILIAFGFIIPKRILDIPKYGFINIHPSLLPKYRGPSPVQSALLAGDKKTGVSIMILDEEMDHGPVLSQEELEIKSDDTCNTLSESLANLGSSLLLKTLPGYLDGSIKAQEQNHSQATYTEKIQKDSGKLDIKNPPSLQTIDRMTRAYYPWPTVWAEVEGKRVKFLPDSKIQMEGKRPMAFNEFRNGYPNIWGKISVLLEEKTKQLQQRK